jgi:hypothetical protein
MSIMPVSEHLLSNTAEPLLYIIIKLKAFLERKNDLVSGMFAHVQRNNPLSKSLPRARPQRVAVQKVHDNDVSTWILNHQEVQTMFRVLFPSFADVVRQTGLAQLCPMALQGVAGNKKP